MALHLAGDRAGRVLVGPDLRPPGLDDVFIIGDTALAHDVAGEPLPGIAPVAKQQSTYVADVIKVQIIGKSQAAALPLSGSRPTRHDRPQDRRHRV
jgi:NADH dehydrogenase